ncbi:hypothetical protein A9Q99_19265 [Gammaproteobacteria bacterium 45_16_T64]|nr:hypothetical protein A9Q99_19265 [Gammaproteobacteria bacterium 45_16_T64]
METQLIDIKADIRERLLHVAIRLFAEKGIEAVSMRAINTAAGTKNKSAVHYHFGSKLGILEAIFAMLSETLDPVFEDLITRVEERSANEDISVAEIVLTSYLPFFIINATESHGKNTIKLFAKMMVDSTPEYQEMYNDYLHSNMERIYQLMKKALPSKLDKHLRYQLMHGLMAMITGLATIDLMANTPLGDIRFANDMDLMLSHVDYVTGGLTNEAPSLDQINIEFWQDYFKEQKVFG